MRIHKLTFLGMILAGCSSGGGGSSTDTGGSKTGGSVASGGTVAATGGRTGAGGSAAPASSGGASATGGAVAATGGRTGMGGSTLPASSGGATAPTGSGGASATGGAPILGGAVGSGGAPGSGGASGSGGTTASGGASSAGGASGSGGKTGTGGTSAAGGASGTGILAATPPMGWNSWNKFGCNVNESMIKGMADAMVSSGMKAAGYQYVNIDDCWQVSRAGDGTIQASTGFTGQSLKTLADYVHGLGLKLGAYSDRGTNTCAGRPGGQGYEVQDANTYAAWGVDYLKYDNCNANLDQQTQYKTMSDALKNNKLNHPIVFSICAWSFQTWEPVLGNLWRTTGDINDSWGSMTGNANTNTGLAKYASPGHWNDPDMLEVGNGGMSDTEYRTHFSLWSIMAAPLIAGNDLRSMSQATTDILTAPEVIAVDQDPLGKQGVSVYSNGDQQIYGRILNGAGQRAVLLFNHGTGNPTIKVSWNQIWLASGAATVRDLWAQKDLGSFTDSYSATVPAHGAVMVNISGTDGTMP